MPPAVQVVDAREAVLGIGGRESVAVAAAIEGLPGQPAFSVMASASRAARPQWAGLVDDLYERPLLKNARTGLHNALMSTITGCTLYRNVFFSFADAVILWHYGHTQQRSGSSRIDVIYTAMLRLLDSGPRFAEARIPPEPDVDYFIRLRRIRLTSDNAYPLLRRVARLLGAVEAEVTGEKMHQVRGSILTSYASFSAQVLAMARALRDGRREIRREDVLFGFLAYTQLVATSPEVVVSSLPPPAPR
jgi:hypothetical protein